MSDKDIQELKIATELLKKDAKQCESLFDRTTITLYKIQETNQNIVKMISLHEQRHDQQEKITDTLNEDIRDIHSRISSTSKEIHDSLQQTLTVASLNLGYLVRERESLSDKAKPKLDLGMEYLKKFFNKVENIYNDIKEPTPYMDVIHF